MTAIQVVLVCVATALACSLLRAVRPELAMGVALAGGVASLFLLRGELEAAFRLVRTLAAQENLGAGSAGLLLRASGIALAAEFGAELCRDAGESALAGRIELGARIALLAMAAPLVQDMLALIVALSGA